jgi:hypothetical protein
MAPEYRTAVVRIYSIATIDAPAKPMWHHKSVIALFQIVLQLLTDLLGLTALAFRQRRSTAAEILVLRRQLALYQERWIKPISTTQIQIRAIGAESHVPSVPIRSSAGCITNTSSPPARD